MDLRSAVTAYVRKVWKPSVAIGIISILLTLSFKVYDIIAFSEANVIGHISKYKNGDIISYSGTIENTSNVHADKLALKGDFSNAEVVDFKINTMAYIEYKNTNPSKSVEFGLKHLPKKSKCLFDILIIPIGETSEKFYVTWGKEGLLNIMPIDADESTIRNIERGMDLSSKARSKWLKSNTKNISRQIR